MPHRRLPRRAAVLPLLPVLLLLLLLLLLAPGAWAWAPPPPAGGAAARPPPVKEQQQHHRLDLNQGLLLLRKTAFVLGLSLLPSAARANTFPGLEDCKTESTPSYTMVTCDTHTGIENGRPKRCQSAENCISTTSVASASKYASPWVYNTENPNAAFLQLVKAVEGEGSLKIVEIDNERHYLRAEAPSKVPPGSIDDLEFLVTTEDSLVFFRTASRQSVFVYPVQSQVPDGGTLKKRLDTIQKKLGWQTVADLYQY